MLSYKSRSLLLHILVLCTFLLPFYFTGCEKIEEALPSKSDSIAVSPFCQVHDRDSIKVSDSTVSQNIPDSLKRISYGSDEVDENPAHKLSLKYLALKPILNPERYTYTGLGVLINIFDVFSMIALAFSVFLLLFALGLKIWNQKAHITWIHSLLAFLFLLIARPLSFHCELLWGYWVCLGFLTLLLIHDGYGLKRSKAFY